MTGVRLLLADVDGTLVTPDKVLTDRAVAAVHQLHDAGILFAVTSGRPPRGMSMLIEPLRLTTPIAAFNGGLIVHEDMSTIEQRTIPADLVPRMIAKLESSGLDVWLYRGADWYVRDASRPHVDREAWTVKFKPTVVERYDGMVDDLAKIVGVSDDTDAVEAATKRAHAEFGEHASVARSQPYYLDITHPEANKGSVLRNLSRTYGIDTGQIATIGDMANDVLMFADSGLSIAMGNASADVQRSADRVTTSNEDEGFARAVEDHILST